jgi:hypothetical protein
MMFQDVPKTIVHRDVRVGLKVEGALRRRKERRVDPELQKKSTLVRRRGFSLFFEGIPFSPFHETFVVVD